MLFLVYIYLQACAAEKNQKIMMVQSNLSISVDIQNSAFPYQAVAARSQVAVCHAVIFIRLGLLCLDVDASILAKQLQQNQVSKIEAKVATKIY